MKGKAYVVSSLLTVALFIFMVVAVNVHNPLAPVLLVCGGCSMFVTIVLFSVRSNE